jgi:hypothetical protein
MNKNLKQEKLQDITKKEELLITFLRKTRNGDYAPIETSSLSQSRITEERIVLANCDVYYYSIT